MNRPGAVPQSLRGMSGFGGQQQQPQQSGRGVANRLPNGKLGVVSGGSGWAFGSGMPMGSSPGVPPGSARQLGGGNVSFAQSLSGSQPATPLDLSEFPTLSNTSQLSTANQASMWSTGARNLGGAVHRGPSTPLSQQGQQDDFFSSRQQSAQGAFRFGNQGNSGQTSQTPSSVTDDFPPLNRSANGELGGMPGLGFGSTPSIHPNRTNNGLLNTLTGNTRTTDGRSPTAIGRPHDQRSPVNEEEGRQKPPVYREDGMASRSSVGDAVSQAIGTRNPLGAIGNDPPSAKGKEEDRGRTNEVQDPLEGMPAIDKFGLKGLRTLMNNYPDYNSLIIGIDPSSLGLELNSSELYSTQIYSILDDVPPRPAVPKFKIPECYMVKNVQPIEAKIQSFNEETLMWIFYSCPGDIKQQLAAAELTTRNWRWHKKLQVWLTKDEMGNTAQLSPAHERGYYIVWDTVNWHKERREFTLYYCDLETNLGVPMPVIGA
ncbi:hypothetical protein B0T13DRAFT_461356 [Neurospora crassa]|nr:hypothetical protein B0T13DRAFT_461356 [Neurospora crassa]